MENAYKKIIYDVDENGVARITLNEPERMNPLGWPLLAELDTALTEAEKDDKVKVIIIKGAGRSFSAGYDLSAIAEGADLSLVPKERKEFGRSVWNSRASVQGHIQYWFKIWNLWKPVIAQVHGFCLAGASELACSCDLIVISEDCRFGYPPTRYMSSGDASALYTWHAGPKVAKEMIFGRILSGKECVQYGFANYSFPADKLEEETTRIANRITHIHPELLMISKQMVNKTYDIRGFRTSIEVSGEYDSLCHRGQDYGIWKTTRDLGVREAMKKLNEPWGGV